jgi:hypothetical protein
MKLNEIGRLRKNVDDGSRRPWCRCHAESICATACAIFASLT